MRETNLVESHSLAFIFIKASPDPPAPPHTHTHHQHQHHQHPSHSCQTSRNYILFQFPLNVFIGMVGEKYAYSGV